MHLKMHLGKSLCTTMKELPPRFRLIGYFLFTTWP